MQDQEKKSLVDKLLESNKKYVYCDSRKIRKKNN